MNRRHRVGPDLRVVRGGQEEVEPEGEVLRVDPTMARVVRRWREVKVEMAIVKIADSLGRAG